MLFFTCDVNYCRRSPGYRRKICKSAVFVQFHQNECSYYCWSRSVYCSVLIICRSNIMLFITPPQTLVLIILLFPSLAAFVLNLLIGGAVNTFGVLYVALLDSHKQGSGPTAWVGSMANAMGLLLGKYIPAFLD